MSYYYLNNAIHFLNNLLFQWNFYKGQQFFFFLFFLNKSLLRTISKVKIWQKMQANMMIRSNWTFCISNIIYV